MVGMIKSTSQSNNLTLLIENFNCHGNSCSLASSDANTVT